MSHRFACIMAGGSGTRFWPQSRAARPKQFLSLDGSDESLLQATVRRATQLMPIDHVFVVTSARHVAETARQLPDLPRENILAEPAGRNTTPCVGWAAVHVQKVDPNGIMMVLPADPHVGDEAGYIATLDKALGVAEQDVIVTVAIEPTRPETGYGYIEPGADLGGGVREVVRFVEKPDLEQAKRFVADGLLWNSGMFFFRARVILEAIAAHQPELSDFLQDCSRAIDAGDEAALVETRYPTLPSVSIDYGIMEKTSGIRVVPGSFGWHDVGSWTSAWELAEHDAEGNASSGEALLLDARNCYVRGLPDKLVAVVGIDDLVVVDTEDALLVVPRDRAQDVGQIVKTLRSNKGDRFV